VLVQIPPLRCGPISCKRMAGALPRAVKAGRYRLRIAWLPKRREADGDQSFWTRAFWNSMEVCLDVRSTRLPLSGCCTSFHFGASANDNSGKGLGPGFLPLGFRRRPDRRADLEDLGRQPKRTKGLTLWHFWP